MVNALIEGIEGALGKYRRAIWSGSSPRENGSRPSF